MGVTISPGKYIRTSLKHIPECNVSGIKKKPQSNVITIYNL